MSGMVLMLTTVPDRAVAAQLAEMLVRERLAACVQISAIESWYPWEGAVEQAHEHRLHIKTTALLADRVERRIAGLHPYAVPEIVTLAIDGGSADYLGWIAAATA